MKHVMVDLETFGNGKNACICQIGACFFDPETGEIGATFKRNVDARTSQESGATFDADTVYWWLSQSPEAIASIIEPGVPLAVAMSELNQFMAGVENIWSHATFDFVIIQETNKRLWIKPMFKYKAARDIRTLEMVSGLDRSAWPPREGVHHDALADAIYQAKYVSLMLRKIENERTDAQAYIDGDDT